MAFNLKKVEDINDAPLQEKQNSDDPLAAEREFFEKYGKIHDLKIDLLVHPAANKFTMNEDDRFEELVDSIEKDGVTGSIIVTPIEGGKFEIVSGNRRIEAAKAAGKKKVDVKVVRFNNEEEKNAFIYTANSGTRYDNLFGNAATAKCALESAGIEISKENKTAVSSYLQNRLLTRRGGALSRLTALVLLDDEIIEGGRQNFYGSRQLYDCISALKGSEKESLLSAIKDVLSKDLPADDKKEQIALLLSPAPAKKETPNKGGRPKKVKTADEELAKVFKSVKTVKGIYKKSPKDQNAETLITMVDELIAELEDLKKTIEK